MTVQMTTLGNGLRIVTHRMDAVETVSLGAWVGVGTRHERPEVNGISHMLEHMAFKGTKRRSARAIAEEIEAVGGHLNAYTSREVTAYHATVLRGDEPLAVDIVADILQNSVFDPDEIERERSVILQEIGQANDTPDDIVFDHFQETAFPDQPVGRPVLGTSEIVGRLQRDSLVGYMSDNYTAPRMVVSAAGKLDHDAFVAMVENQFGSLDTGDRSARDPARYAGGEYREERDLEQVHLLLGFEGVPYGDPDYYALSVLSTLLGGGMSSRLFQEIREIRGLAYSIYSFGSSYQDSGLFGIYAGTGEDQAAELVSVLGEELNKLADGIAPEEISRARAQLKAGVLMSLESTASRSEQLARQVMIYGAPRDIGDITSRIDDVVAADLLGVAARLLDSSPTLASMGPLGGVPALSDMAAALR